MFKLASQPLRFEVDSGSEGILDYVGLSSIVMRVVCINIPKGADSPANAIYVTKWDHYNVRFFLHQLDELAEIIWEPFSLEMYASANTVYFCLAGAAEIVDILSVGIYTWMGNAQIVDIEDYTNSIGQNGLAASADLHLWRPDIYPINEYRNFATNSLTPVLMPLQQLPTGDGMLIQVIVRPIKDSAWSHLALRRTRARERFNRLFRARNWFKGDLPIQSNELILNKCRQHLFWTNYRITAFSEESQRLDPQLKKATLERLKGHIERYATCCGAYNLSDQNRLNLGRIETGISIARRVRERQFIQPFRLSSSEITTLYHPPPLMTIQNTAQVLSLKAPAPPSLPTPATDSSIGSFAHTNYRDHEIEFGIKRADRRRHLYVLGKSGSGKSCLLQLLIKDDIDKGFGCAVLDPHGDLVDDILRLVPKHRVNDVVLFDPSSKDFAPSFNPMAPVRPELKLRVAMSFLDSFKRVFRADWSEKMDHVLRYAMLGLLSAPGCNLISLRRMLTDERYRAEIVRQAKDESVKRFWLREFTARRKEFEEGPISRLLNRLDELLATDSVRHILGQSQNLFNFRDFMDSRKIVLLKVSKGVLGSENATLLGSLLLWKVYEAAMSRADMPASDRQDFYLYVDEFQNFATDSFTEILSEARKYNLNLTFANQYLNQLPSSIRKTIFGNVANLLSFRVGAEDAGAVSAEFAPQFGDGDLINLAIRDFYIRMSIDGLVQNPFSGRTVDLRYPAPGKDFAEACIAASQKKYCIPMRPSPSRQTA